MSAIQTLRTIFQKEGLQYIHNLFNKEVIISEKLNATRFCFDIDKTGTFCFYKKDGKLTKIDRVINRIYEDPIRYIENLPENIKSEIPINHRIGFRYFHNKSPIHIEYNRSPINGLVLTDITNPNGEVIYDQDFIYDLADKLKVEKPLIIFQGKLDESQKLRIIEYLRLSETEILERFKGESFTKFFFSILNPELRNTTLSENLESSIDSIIFKFISENEIINAKVMDPNIQKTKEGERTPRDISSIILIDLLEFIKINTLEVYNLKSKTEEERYLELMCSIFNKFIRRLGYRYEDLEIDYSYMDPIYSKVNLDLIKNEKTLEHLKSSQINQNIFKILISSFSKPRRKPIGIMSEITIKDLRNISNQIKKIIEVSPTNESIKTIPTFGEWLNS